MAPPAALLRAVDAMRGGLQRLRLATVPAPVAVLELGFGAWLAQALAVAVRLGIPDQLRDGPRGAEDVAQRLGTHPGATYRLMRALAAQSVLKLRRDGRFALTRTGRALLSGDTAGVAAMIAFIGDPAHREHWSDLEHSVRTGRTAADKVRGMPFFDYLGTNPELAQVFNDAMTGASAVAIESAVPAYDFSGAKKIVDVGGGHGALLAAVLRRAPEARGVLFDLPAVVAARMPPWPRPESASGPSCPAGPSSSRSPPAATSICSRPSSTTGTTSSRWRFCAMSAAPSPRTAGCCCWRWCCPRALPASGPAAGPGDADQRGRAGTHPTRVRRTAVGGGIPAAAGDSDGRPISIIEARPV